MQNIELVQARVHWQVFNWTVLNLQEIMRVRKFLCNWVNIISGKMFRHWIRGVFKGMYFVVTCQPTFIQCVLELCSSNLIIFLVTLNHEVSFNAVFIILMFSDTVGRVLVSGDVILRMTERNSSAKKLVLKDWGNQWKVSYYFESDSTSESPELPHYFVLFCFRTRNILGTIYS